MAPLELVSLIAPLEFVSLIAPLEFVSLIAPLEFVSLVGKMELCQCRPQRIFKSLHLSYTKIAQSADYYCHIIKVWYLLKTIWLAFLQLHTPCLNLPAILCIATRYSSSCTMSWKLIPCHIKLRTYSWTMLLPSSTWINPSGSWRAGEFGEICLKICGRSLCLNFVGPRFSCQSNTGLGASKLWHAEKAGTIVRASSEFYGHRWFRCGCFNAIYHVEWNNA